VEIPGTFISTSRHDSNTFLTAISKFSGSNNPIGLPNILCDLTGSQISKMAVFNLEIRIPRLVDMVATQF